MTLQSCKIVRNLMLMKNIYALSFLILLSFTVANAQTKLISFKSHSGRISNFKTVLANNLFDIKHSNFGVAPTPEVLYAVLDSIVYINDSTSIMWTSSFCTWGRRGRDTIDWTPGGTYLHRHPLFSRKHSLDSIKNVLDKEYNFRNPADSVVFIGYDNIQPDTQIDPAKTGTSKSKPVLEKKNIEKNKPQKQQEQKKLKQQKQQKQLKKKKVKSARASSTKSAVFIPIDIQDHQTPPPSPWIIKVSLIGILGFIAIFIGIVSSKRKRPIFHVF